jgi:hypothetical protein
MLGCINDFFPRLFVADVRKLNLYLVTKHRVHLFQRQTLGLFKSAICLSEVNNGGMGRTSGKKKYTMGKKKALQAMKTKLNFQLIAANAIGAVWVKMMVIALEQKSPIAKPTALFLVGKTSAAYTYGTPDTDPKKNMKIITIATPPLPKPIRGC